MADLFVAEQRGLALTLFNSMCFLGLVLGPIVGKYFYSCKIKKLERKNILMNILGGFTGSAMGWRWVQGVMTIFTGVLAIIGITFFPETYAPALLRWRVAKLSKFTGLVYRSKFEEKNHVTFSRLLKISLSRPWILLIREPIVLLLSIYIGLINGTFYLLIGAFTIVYGEQRGWTPGSVGLAFLGIAVGLIMGVFYCIWENRRYTRLAQPYIYGRPPPETRLPPAIVGACALPVSLFWFAWTNYPSIHCLSSIAACVPFGFGIMLVFVATFNYLVDSYVIYAASALAANAILRSSFGAVFRKFSLN